jgi:hypothetical protein
VGAEGRQQAAEPTCEPQPALPLEPAAGRGLEGAGPEGVGLVEAVRKLSDGSLAEVGQTEAGPVGADRGEEDQAAGRQRGPMSGTLAPGAAAEPVMELGQGLEEGRRQGHRNRGEGRPEERL